MCICYELGENYQRFRVHDPQARLLVSRVLENLTPANMFCSDSPVSQLLQHALAPAAQSQEHSKEWGLASPNDGNTAIDFSLDSRIIPARPVTPCYRLQVSSLQSPEGSGESVLAEDSHEENHQQKSELGSITSPVPLKNAPIQLGSRRPSGSVLFHQYGDSPVTASAGKVIGEPLFMSFRHSYI